jgi:hypothetical protein
MIEASQPFGKNKWPGAHADPSSQMMLPQKRVDPPATRSYAPIYPLQLRLVDNTGTSFMKTLVLRLMFFAIHEGFNILWLSVIPVVFRFLINTWMLSVALISVASGAEQAGIIARTPPSCFAVIIEKLLK